jgi:hypothetical protein
MKPKSKIEILSVLAIREILRRQPNLGADGFWPNRSTARAINILAVPAKTGSNRIYSPGILMPMLFRILTGPIRKKSGLVCCLVCLISYRQKEMS